MVHAKVVVIDERYIDMGSANFTPLSHGVYDEINVFIDDSVFAHHIIQTLKTHFQQGNQSMGNTHGYRRISAQIERIIMAFQSRNGG